ncbi:Ferric reductase, NADH/NADPH oxidase transmembrane component (6 domains) [Scheffersomyces stipitis CBS 6054]|uniref:ferric-chelate reductase (NADPH) n=1 Tax=Scheffersomyces stipitis (strain ATCC 58785 / CBS 6054 / NBRC 10063 / NRRL Y-11545) TaxID=322104 RepID=A3GG56_PICST|nr:Ferric reductase, NADH/NADPH oxidase transmembrane component (6 domains) [Scheffersomyces stipitis CBS 6054]EAZ63877.2 Ferric reductase, NADH/NADPH oxidase transmembrane component (6 domains) [Scheffersomyces stipitis CBS 6054]
MNLIAVFNILVYLTVISAHGASSYTKYGHLIDIYTCRYSLMQTASFCKPPLVGDACLCTNPNGFASMVGCLHQLGKNSTSNIELIGKLCLPYNITRTPEMFEEAYKNFTRNAKSPSQIDGYNRTVPVNVPVILNEQLAKITLKSYTHYLHNFDYSLYYGGGMVAYWALVFILGAVCNWSKLLFPGIFRKMTGPFSAFIRKYITMPATFRKSKAQEKTFLRYFQILIPSRLETLVISGFVVVTIVCNAIDIYYMENDPLFPTKTRAISKYLGDRTGITGTILIPLFMLFAGRNNFLQWVTRWNYATFLTYHKWVARIDFILIVIHSITYTLALDLRYPSEIKLPYLYWGVVGTVAGGISFVQAVLYLRRNWYEMFLLVHIILAVLWIVGGWIHVEELGYINFYYASVAVWVFDRVARIGRLLVFGFPKAQVTLLAGETLKVVIPKPSYWQSIPGGHAFIHFLRPSCFWQSHPFTFTDSVENKDSIVLYAKVKGGITHSLYQYLAAHPGKTTQVRVGVEGPYGESTAAYKYDSAVYVAGGNGIPGIFSEAVDSAIRSKDSRHRVKLFWIIRDYKTLLWFHDELLELKKTKIQTTVIVTKPESQRPAELKRLFSHSPQEKLDLVDDKKDTIDSENEKVSGSNSENVSNDEIVSTIQGSLGHITFKTGRPNMEELVQDEIKESSGSTAFVACGHPLMVDDIRYAVVQNLDNSEKKRVEFFEQLQIWT